MSNLSNGAINVTIPSHINFPENAGSLTAEQIAEAGIPRSGLRSTCLSTAKALRENSQKIVVPGVTPEDLEASGAAAEDMAIIVSEAEVMLHQLKQGTRLLEAEAYTFLRRTLAQLRAAEKFDPNIGMRFPELIEYFSVERKATPPAASTSAPAPAPAVEATPS